MVKRESFSESITDLIIATLGSARSTHRFRSILFECKLKRYKKESIRVALYKLRSNNYVKNSELGWSLTETGKKFIKNRYLLGYIQSPFEKNSPANTIISFDIPEKNRKIRNWLRNQIKIFGYKMLQQSLWLGPGPLPASFFKRLEDLNIRKNIKTFRIKKSTN
jgi:DNA-binding transcriptional regulator PaaX